MTSRREERKERKESKVCLSILTILVVALFMFYSKTNRGIQQINRQGGQGNKAPSAKFQAKAVADYNAKSARELSFRSGGMVDEKQCRGTTCWLLFLLTVSLL